MSRVICHLAGHYFRGDLGVGFLLENASADDGGTNTRAAEPGTAGKAGLGSLVLFGVVI